MHEDPFARFERSRGGLLIPVFIFLLGAVPTAYAVRAMDAVIANTDLPQTKEGVEQRAVQELQFQQPGAKDADNQGTDQGSPEPEESS